MSRPSTRIPIILSLNARVRELKRCISGLADARDLGDLTLQSQWLREIEDEANAILTRVRHEAGVVRDARAQHALKVRIGTGRAGAGSRS